MWLFKQLHMRWCVCVSAVVYLGLHVCVCNRVAGCFLPGSCKSSDLMGTGPQSPSCGLTWLSTCVPLVSTSVLSHFAFLKTIAHSVAFPLEKKQRCWADKKVRTFNNPLHLCLFPTVAQGQQGVQVLGVLPSCGVGVHWCFRRLPQPRPLLATRCHRDPNSTIRGSLFWVPPPI